MFLFYYSDGNWGEWSVCSCCSGAPQYREKECNNPAPAPGGATCVGDSKDFAACANNQCGNNLYTLFDMLS